MSGPLFDAPGPMSPIERSVRDLGQPITTYCTEEGGTIVFERGELSVTADQWFWMYRVFQRALKA